MILTFMQSDRADFVLLIHLLVKHWQMTALYMACLRGHRFMTSTRKLRFWPLPLSTWAGPFLPPLWTSTWGRH